MALLVLVFSSVLYCLPSILPGESDTITPDEYLVSDPVEFPVDKEVSSLEDEFASSGTLTITTYTGHQEAHLITFPDGTTMSIDCGYEYGDAETITTISHFHSDHCGDCDGFYPTYQYDRNNVVPGEVIYDKDGVTVTVVAANGVVIGQEPAGPYDCGGLENDWSMALWIKYGGFDYLTAGDLEGVELALGAALKERGIHIDVHKVSHHGSRTSSSLFFLLNILPEYAVIAGGGSEPPPDTLWGLVFVGVKRIYYAHSYPVYTDYPICVATNGAVTTITDGYTYSISGGACGDYHVEVDETPTPTPTETPTQMSPTSTPSASPTAPTATPTETPTIPPTPTITPTPVAKIVLSNPEARIGGQVDAWFMLREPIEHPFTAFAVIIMPNGKMLNALTLDTPVRPVAKNVSNLPAPFSYLLLSATVPPGAPRGVYEVVTAFFYADKSICSRQDAFLETSALFTIAE